MGQKETLDDLKFAGEFCSYLGGELRATTNRISSLNAMMDDTIKASKTNRKKIKTTVKNAKRAIKAQAAEIDAISGAIDSAFSGRGFLKSISPVRLFQRIFNKGKAQEGQIQFEEDSSSVFDY